MLDAARRDPARLFIGIDPVADAMAASANRARREKLDNVLFVMASVEAIPAELGGAADRVTVLFPWGSLLEGLVRAHPQVLGALTRLARPATKLDIVINSSALATAVDLAAYPPAGITIERVRREEKAPYVTTWGKRVGLRSDVLHVTGRFGID